MRVLLFTLLMGIGRIPFAYAQHAEIKFLKDHTVTLSPDSNDFSFLKPYLENKQFLFLSDGHQDGTTKIYFTQLITYLHEQMDFDVLLLETDLYSSANTFSEIHATPEKANEIAKSDIIHFISHCDDAQNLFNYVGTTSNTNYPLYLTGFDIGFVHAEHQLNNKIDSVLERNHSALLYTNTYELFMNYFDSLLLQNGRVTWDSIERQFMFDYADTLSEALSQCDDVYWSLIGGNIRAYIKGSMFKTPVYNANTRNEQMYKNLQWLMRVKYPGKKFIIWASPAHLAPGFFPGEIAMTTYLYADYSRDQVFYIAADHYTAGGIKNTNELARKLHKTNRSACMLFFHESVEAEQFFYDITASKYFDALLFIDRVDTCVWADD